MKTPKLLPQVVAFLAFCAKVAFAQSVSPVAPVSSTPNQESEVIELSPFVVRASIDRGYESGNTLSGTRMNTPTKFVGAAITDVNQALMEDLGVFNVEQVIDFTPNAVAFDNGGSLTDQIVNRAHLGPSFVVRGVVISSTSRDFIKNRVADDAYNIDRVSIARGPNSTLFGIAEPSGLINTVGTRALMKDSYSIGARFDNWDSHRETFRLNKQVIKGKFAIFLAGLAENKRANIDPSDKERERLTGSLTIKPFKSTTVRATFEHGHISDLIYRPWPAADGLTSWIEAGSQEIPVAGLNGGARFATIDKPTAGQRAQQAAIQAQLTAAGFQLATRALAVAPIFVLNGSGSNAMPPLDALGFVVTRFNAGVGAAKVQNGTLIDSPIPYTANIGGYGSQRLQKFQSQTFSIEQAVGKHLFLEATFNRQNTNNTAVRTFNIQFNQLLLDKNPTLLTMGGKVIPNPNYNRYFTNNNNPGITTQNWDDETRRLQVAYDFDFRERLGGPLGRLLGHHNFGAVREYVSAASYSNIGALINMSPQALVGVTPQIGTNGTTSLFAQPNGPIQFNAYIDPGDSSTWALPDIGDMYWNGHVLFAGDPIPAADPSGVTPSWVARSSTKNLTITNSRSLMLQSYFWDDRIVTTFGWREDKVETRNLANANVSYNGQSGWVPDAYPVNIHTGDDLHPITYLKSIGRTKNLGVVAYPLPWLGLFFNQSENFQPGGANSFDIFGHPLDLPRAKGRDYGVKISMLRGRISINLDRYTIQQRNNPTSIFTTGFGGTFRLGLAAPLYAISNELFGATGDFKFRKFPWIANPATGGENWLSTSDVQSEGYECSITANLTRNWRLTANVSKQFAASSNYGAIEQQWHDEQLAYVQANYSHLLNVSTQVGARGVAETLQQDFEDVQSTLTQALTLSGRRDARQPEYSGNIITAYDFTTGALKGFGVGGSYRWRGKTVIGYGFLPGSTTLFDVDNPFYGPSRNPIGLFVSYKFKLGKKLRARVQLNADDINMDENLYPYYATDLGDGTPLVSQYAVGQGKTFALSVSLDY